VASSTAPAAAHEWAEADALLVELVRSGEVPAFPRNKSSLAALLPVLRAAKAGTAQAQLVKEEKLRGSKVYQQEVARLQERLAGVKLGLDSLSESGRLSLSSIAAAAAQLSLRDARPASLALGVSELALEEQASEASQTRARQWGSHIQMLHSAAAQRLRDLERMLARAEDAEKENSQRCASMESGAPLLLQKQEQYKGQIRQYRKQLHASGYFKECEHAALRGEGAALAQMEADLLRGQAEVAGYHGIPVEPATARNTLEQSAAALANLQRRIEEHLGHA